MFSKVNILLCLIALTGRMPTATTSEFAIPNVSAVSATELSGYSSADPILVKIRFPASYSDSAEQHASQQLVQAFFPSPDEGQAESAEVLKMRANFSASETLNDTTYLAMELYGALTERLPAKSVILEPMEVQLEEGNLVYRSMLPIAPPPALSEFTVSTLSNPDLNALMISKYVTFGDMVTPSFTLRTDPARNPTKPTYGLETAFEGICSNGVQAAPLVDCINGTNSLSYTRDNFPTEYEGNLIDAKKFRIDLHLVKTENERIDDAGNRIREQAYMADPSSVLGSYARAFSPMVALIESFSKDLYGEYLTDQRDLQKAYLTVIDGSNSDVEITGMRAAYLEKFYEEEKSIFSDASRQLYSAIYEKKFGNEFRKYLALEAGLLEDRRSIARRSNANKFMGMLAGVAAGAATNNSSLMMSTVETVAAQTESFEQQSIDLQNSFTQALTNDYIRQILARKEIAVDGADLTGNVAELRDQFKSKLDF